MGKIKKLHFNEISGWPTLGDEDLYPVTHIDAIFDDEGNSLRTLLAQSQGSGSSSSTIPTYDLVMAYAITSNILTPILNRLELSYPPTGWKTSIKATDTGYVWAILAKRTYNETTRKYVYLAWSDGNIWTTPVCTGQLNGESSSSSAQQTPVYSYFCYIFAVGSSTATLELSLLNADGSQAGTCIFRTDGGHDLTPPSGWSTSPNGLTCNAGESIYYTYRTFYSDGTPSYWQTPIIRYITSETIIQDSSSNSTSFGVSVYKAVAKNSESIPSTPTYESSVTVSTTSPFSFANKQLLVYPGGWYGSYQNAVDAYSTAYMAAYVADNPSYTTEMYNNALAQSKLCTVYVSYNNFIADYKDSAWSNPRTTGWTDPIEYAALDGDAIANAIATKFLNIGNSTYLFSKELAEAREDKAMAIFGAVTTGSSIFKLDGSGQLAGGLILWGKGVGTTVADEFGLLVSGHIRANSGSLGGYYNGNLLINGWTIGTGVDSVTQKYGVMYSLDSNNNYMKITPGQLAAGNWGTNDNDPTFGWVLNSDGSGQIGSGTTGISWNKEGAVTFGSAVTLDWGNISGDKPDGSSSGSGLTDELALKLTHIDANGVYTGKVSAEALAVKSANVSSNLTITDDECMWFTTYGSAKTAINEYFTTNGVSNPNVTANITGGDSTPVFIVKQGTGSDAHFFVLNPLQFSKSGDSTAFSSYHLLLTHSSWNAGTFITNNSCLPINGVYGANSQGDIIYRKDSDLGDLLSGVYFTLTKCLDPILVKPRITDSSTITKLLQKSISTDKALVLMLGALTVYKMEFYTYELGIRKSPSGFIYVMPEVFLTIADSTNLVLVSVPSSNNYFFASEYIEISDSLMLILVAGTTTDTVYSSNTSFKRYIKTDSVATSDLNMTLSSIILNNKYASSAYKCS